jgi:protein-L-isoaspartate(D-aspartate) O-methyltransferase
MRLGLVVMSWVVAFIPPIAKAADQEAQRRKMIAEIADMAARTSGYTGIKAFDERIISALREVPRHEFVPQEQKHAAYRNHPLPIGHGQTISQPFIVALMSQLLAADKTGNVLEVGTGSGYQAAVLCELFDQVYSIEIVPELGRMAKATLDRLGYTNIQTKIGDGYKGWPQHAPFDGILVTAAPNHIPKPLVDQLKPGGRMVIPVGDFSQDLLVVTKQDDGASLSRTVLPVRFVPLVRGRQQ